MNEEFQELKGKFNAIAANRDCVIQEMRSNLLIRNGSEKVYTFQYTQNGLTCDIENCSVEELLAIDGDMCPMGL